MALPGLIPTTLNGLETLQVGMGPSLGGGEGMEVTTGQMTNTTRGFTTNVTSGTIQWPVPPGFVNANNVAQYSTIVFTAASVSATLNLPPFPFDGQVVEIINGSGSAFTALTPATTDGSTLVNTGTYALAAGGSAQLYYLKVTNSWYRMR